MINIYIKQALKNFFAKKILNVTLILTIFFFLFASSSLILVATNINQALNFFSKEIIIVSYIKKNTSALKINKLKSQLLDYEEIKEINFVSNDHALNYLKDKMHDFAFVFENLKENPLLDSLEIKIASSVQNWEKVEKIASFISKKPFIEDVEYYKGQINKVIKFLNFLKFLSLILSFFFFTTLLFISIIFSSFSFNFKKDEIHILQTLGADKYFVQIPFMIEGALNGLIGGFLALFGSYLVFEVFIKFAKEAWSASPFNFVFIAHGYLLFIISFSIFLGIFGCFFSTKKKLKNF